MPHHLVLLPGPAIPTLNQVAVDDHPRPPGPGEYYITTVYRRPATLWWSLRALIQSDWTLMAGDLNSPQSQSQMPENHAVLRQVVYQTCGLEAPVQVRVLDLTPDSPLRGQLSPGDRLLQLNGSELRGVGQIREILEDLPSGQPVTLRILNLQGQQRQIEVIPRPIGGLNEDKGLGLRLLAVADPSELPRIHLLSGDYQGNSADLMLALDACERLLGVNLRHNRKISGSGGLGEQGGLSSVQGLRQKWASARKVGADIFFVPWSDQAQIRELQPGPHEPQIIPVRSLGEAIQWLQNSPP